MMTTVSNEKSLFDEAFRRACSFYPSGVVIVAVMDSHGSQFGFTASTFCSVSSEPALVSLSVACGSAGLKSLLGCTSFSVNVLSESQADLAKEFGTRGMPRFKDPSVYTLEDGAPILLGAAVHFICEVRQVIPAGDHCLMLAAVRRVAMPCADRPSLKPLVYWRRAFLRLHLEYPFLTSGKTLQEFICHWEAGVLNRTAWTHAAHVAVSAWYAFSRSPEELVRTMKAGIIGFNARAGIGNGPDSGYHETLTRFWSNIISSWIRQYTFACPFEAAQAAVKLFGEDRDLHSLYYSFDVVRSRQARCEWIAPDREPSADWYVFV